MQDFPITTRARYLNTGWAGPSSREAIAAMAARAEREAYDGPQSPDVRVEKAQLVRGVRERFARLIGADLDEVALMYTTTEGVNAVIRGIGLQRGDDVITCNLEHNSVMVPAYFSRDTIGFDLSVVRFPSRDETAASIVDTFAQAMTPNTKLLVLSHVSWNRGTRLPMREICEMAHARGAVVCVDAAQSAGHIDFNVRALNCDFLAMPGHKWLFGPAGAAAFYVRRDLIERIQPLVVVHGANRHYDFAGHFEYANQSIHKFELTTHSGPVLAGLTVALDAALDETAAARENHSLELADRFVHGLQQIDGVRITTPLDVSVRSGIVTWTIGDLNPHECVAALWSLDRIAARVCNDRRIRACFAAFNTNDDVARTLAAVKTIARSGIPSGTPPAEEWTARMSDGED